MCPCPPEVGLLRFDIAHTIINAARRAQADAVADRLRPTRKANLHNSMPQRQIIQELHSMGIEQRRTSNGTCVECSIVSNGTFKLIA